MEEPAEEEAEEAEAEEAAEVDVIRYVVQPGDNLFRIGLRYNITWIELADFNDIRYPRSLRVGETILIPTAPTPAATPPPDTPTTYVVQRGDTLAEIGRRFGVSWIDIARANNIVNPNRILVGQTLTIPGVASAAPAPAPATPSREVSHTVQRGQSLYRISRLYNVPWTRIAEANDITAPYVIYPGQVLTIPSE